METGKIYAVLTGDLIGSSRFRIEEREKILSILKDSFKKISPNIIESPFGIFRGDSFQGVLSRPDEALNTALIIRASLLSRFTERRPRLDARIAIGIGTISYLPDQAGEGDGEAFRNSGPELDKMKKGEQNSIIMTPWTEINEELQTECALLDALIQRWTEEQAEATLYQILNKIFLGEIPDDIYSKVFIQGETQEGRTQKVVAKLLSISQPALSQRLKTGGFWAVQVFLERFKVIIQNKIRLEPYNHAK